MTTNLAKLNNKINNYIALHPELCTASREEVMSIMVKNFELSLQEAELLKTPSIYSNPFATSNGEYVSEKANDCFVKTDSSELQDSKSNIQHNSLIPNVKMDNAGIIDTSQFSVKELLKKYEPPEYKIKRDTFQDGGESISITNNNNDIVFFLNKFDDNEYDITINKKNIKYSLLIKDEKLYDCLIIEKKSNGSYTQTQYWETIKTSQTSYNKNDEVISKTNFVVNDLLNSKNNVDVAVFKDKILNEIIQQNIDEILLDYSKETNSDLIIDIKNNPNLNNEEKSQLINHLTTLYTNCDINDYGIDSYIVNIIENDIGNKNTENLITHLEFITNKDSKNIINKLKENSNIDDNIQLEIYSLFSDYNPNYVKNNSRIINKYHKGTSYYVKQNKDYQLEVKSWATGKVTTIDLKKICKDIPIKYQPYFFEVIQKLPGEVLEDIANEADFNFDLKGAGGKERAYFNYNKDRITLTEYAINENTIVHELGHAIDYNTKYKTLYNQDCDENELWASGNSKIEQLFNEELEAYINKGNTRYEEVSIYDKETKSWILQTPSDAPYCTWNLQEFFAESYGLLMTERPGDYESVKCIENNFTKTFAAIKAELAAIRKRPANERH